MANELVPLGEESRRLSCFDIQNYHPLEVLYRINPEIASLAYANRENWLKPEIMPHLAKFRECQAHEKITFLDSIVRKSAIDSNERIQMEVQRTLEAIAKLEQEGEIEVETIKTQGMVEAERIKYGSETEMVRIQSQAAIDIQKAKYETDIKLLEEQMKGQCYLSDNQVKATLIEAEAIRDAIIFTERVRAMSEDKKTEAQLKQAIHQAEVELMTKIYEAESIRLGEHDERVARIIESYIAAQAQMFRDSLRAKLEFLRVKGAAERKSYQTISEIARTVILHSKSERTSVRGRSKYGSIEVVVEKDEKNDI